MSIEKVLDRVHDVRLPGYGDDEVAFLAQTLEEWLPDAIYEWGTNRGSSARIFYEAARIFQIDGCAITTIDLPSEQEFRDRDHAGEHTAIFVRGLDVETVRGDGVTEALKRCGAAQPERPLFFVDGDHWEPTVLRELEMIHEVAPHAVIVMHDTHHLGNAPQGPRLALNTFLEKNPDAYKVVELASQAGMVRLWPQ